MSAHRINVITTTFCSKYNGSALSHWNHRIFYHKFATMEFISYAINEKIKLVRTLPCSQWVTSNVQVPIE